MMKLTILLILLWAASSQGEEIYRAVERLANIAETVYENYCEETIPMLHHCGGARRSGQDRCWTMIRRCSIPGSVPSLDTTSGRPTTVDGMQPVLDKILEYRNVFDALNKSLCSDFILNPGKCRVSQVKPYDYDCERDFQSDGDLCKNFKNLLQPRLLDLLCVLQVEMKMTSTGSFVVNVPIKRDSNKDLVNKYLLKIFRAFKMQMSHYRSTLN